MISIYTDGACSGNPGPGGWAAVIIEAGQQRSISGGERQTTNNRMELLAVINALRCLHEGQETTVFTDSQYVQLGMSKWLAAWQKRNWQTAGKKEVKNRELWEALLEASKKRIVRWRWVKGHSGHPHNTEADRLARLALEDYK